MNTKVDEGKLISGKEAKLAWANGEKLEYTSEALGGWFDVNGGNTLDIFYRSDFKFRLKPRTITINSIEVPSVRYIAHSGGNCVKISCHCPEDARVINAALRQVFGGNHDN